MMSNLNFYIECNTMYKVTFHILQECTDQELILNPSAGKFFSNFSLDSSGVYILHFPLRTEYPSKVLAILSKIYLQEVCPKEMCTWTVLSKLYIKYLITSSFLTCWKSSSEFQVFKNSVLSNYRVISCLPLFGKLLEVIIYAEFFKRLTSQDLLSNKQYGFHFCVLTATTLIFNATTACY